MMANDTEALHRLPCHVDYEGTVESLPALFTASRDGDGHLHGSFRGRKLFGVECVLGESCCRGIHHSNLYSVSLITINAQQESSFSSAAISRSSQRQPTLTG